MWLCSRKGVSVPKENVGGYEPMENDNLSREGEAGQEESSEFDSEKWEEIKANKGMGTYRVLTQGMEMGVPQSELEIFFQEIIALKRSQGDYRFEFDLRKSLSRTSQNWGSPEEIRIIGDRAYQEEFAHNDFAAAASLAKDLYGKDSSEYITAIGAVKANEEIEQDAARIKAKPFMAEEDEEDEEEPTIRIKLSTDATLADLFSARDTIEEAEGLGSLELEAELHDNFDEGLVEKILDNQGGNEKVIDFFARYGRSKEDIETYLPIKFT